MPVLVLVGLALLVLLFVGYYGYTRGVFVGSTVYAVTQAGAASSMAKAQTEGLGGAVGKIKTSLVTAMIAGVEPFKDDLVDLVLVGLQAAGWAAEVRIPGTVL